MSGDTRTDRDALAEALPCVCPRLVVERTHHRTSCPADHRDAVEPLLAAARAEGRAEVTAAVEAVIAKHGWWLRADAYPLRQKRCHVSADEVRAALADPGQALAAHDAYEPAAELSADRYDREAEAGGPDNA